MDRDNEEAQKMARRSRVQMPASVLVCSLSLSLLLLDCRNNRNGIPSTFCTNAPRCPVMKSLSIVSSICIVDYEDDDDDDDNHGKPFALMITIIMMVTTLTTK